MHTTNYNQTNKDTIKYSHIVMIKEPAEN